MVVQTERLTAQKSSKIHR